MNRDLSKVIYIDFDPESFRFNPENVLRLPKWDGTLDDTALVDLAELLKSNLNFHYKWSFFMVLWIVYRLNGVVFFSAIHLSDVDDVRPTLQYYSQFDNPLKEFRERAARVAELVIVFEYDIIYYVVIVWPFIFSFRFASFSLQFNLKFNFGRILIFR